MFRYNTTMEQSQTVEVLKALADDTRLAIIRRVAKGTCAVPSCDIVRSCASTCLSQPAMSHHFGKLVSAGILREEKQGTSKVYRLNTEALAVIGIDVAKL